MFIFTFLRRNKKKCCMENSIIPKVIRNDPAAICFGTGRFLRAVLVPVLKELQFDITLAQTRGTDFIQNLDDNDGVYEIDTIQFDGSVDTEQVAVDASLSLGNENERAVVMRLPEEFGKVEIIGLGVTEAGLNSKGKTMFDVAEFLYHHRNAFPDCAVSIINMDNVPFNGNVVAKCLELNRFTQNVKDRDAFIYWLKKFVTCHNTMVDRITAARKSNTFVPCAEPLPKKALVIEDLEYVLPLDIEKCAGVLVRRNVGEIDKDHLLKLRIANGTHTSMVYAMALSNLSNTTDCLNPNNSILKYLDRLFHADILPGLLVKDITKEDAIAEYDQWIRRLKHPYFGMDCFFVSQNATTKLPIRVLSSVFANAQYDANYRASDFMAFSIAAMLRYLTPSDTKYECTERGKVFHGKLDKHGNKDGWEYCTGLFARPSEGYYEFRDPNDAIPLLLQDIGTNKITPSLYAARIISCLCLVKDFDMQQPIFQDLASKVSTIYTQMIDKRDVMGVLNDLLVSNKCHSWLSIKDIASTVREEIENVEIIDVHTHLFPPSHGDLMLWGIDELLTYHYLVAEYFISAPSNMTPEKFALLGKIQQANLVWQHLFIERSPLSEACRGIVTTMVEFGLSEFVKNRDLDGLRAWFSKQDKYHHMKHVFRLSNLKYVVMTNIPFDAEESKHWLQEPKPFDRRYFKSALRVDQLLCNDWQAITSSLNVFNLEHDLQGVDQLLRKWINIMQPEYFMTSVPHTFEYPNDETMSKISISEISAATFLRRVLLPLAEEYQLPIAFKFDSVRPINARLGIAGDGVKPTNVSILAQLCTSYPNIKFLATFLSRVNQHEVCVVANKFSNLHIYGCWWYCNNPSIVDEITRMRIEMLGTAFTSQHSDARVLDQLVYKWKHSRHTIGKVLHDMYTKLVDSGWQVSREDIKRDVDHLFGKSYEMFMAK